MKKIKYIILAAVLIVAGIYLGCDIPDYSLGFEIVGSEVSSPGTFRIYYWMENIGWEDMYNAQIRFEIGTVEGTIVTEWTYPPQDLVVGEVYGDKGSIDPFDPYVEYIEISFPSAETVNYYYITGAAWDTEDSTW